MSAISVPPAGQRVLIALNPKAGSRSGRPVVERLIARLQESGLQVESFTDIARLGEAAARSLEQGSLRAVIAAGGDGTVSLVANATPRGTPLLVVPLGTENLLSKYLGMDPDPERLCSVLQQGATIRLDAGQAAGRLFLLMVGCGFDADVVRRLHQERTGHIHHLSYAKPILDSIRNYAYPELRVRCDAHDEEGRPISLPQPIRARWVFVANLPVYARGLRVVPHADGTDGLVDVCTFKDGSFWNGLRYLYGVAMNQHQSWDDCINVRAAEVHIESDEPVPVQLDGDPGGFLPLDIKVLPERLTLLVSAEWAAKQGFQLSAGESIGGASQRGEAAGS